MDKNSPYFKKNANKDTMAPIRRRNTIREDMQRAEELNAVKNALEQSHAVMDAKLRAVMNFIENAGK